MDSQYITIENYGFGKDHDPRSKEIFRFIEQVDLHNGDSFYFKSGGDGDNGEFLMDLLDAYFKAKDKTLVDSVVRPYNFRMNCEHCHTCLEGKTNEWGFPITSTRMILCVKCGNKRCPHATDHNLECANSNEPGQKGSVYE